MIVSYRDRETAKIARGVRSARLPGDIQDAARRKLRLLDAAATVSDLLNPPGNRLERLRGDRDGQYSLRVNEQWRLCFRWDEGGAHDVEIVDYHR